VNVLSLFDGISCGQVALERIGMQVDSYYASEIDKHAMKVAQNNYPNTIQLGDITQWRSWDIDWSSIDLLLAGFPCQAWSVAGKQQGDNDPRGALVHDLIAIWNKCKEHNKNIKFLFENVRMKKEFLEYINNLFGVEPILINSALVSAQNRKRYYWTNIDDVAQPADKGIILKDIVHETVADDVELSCYIVPFNESLAVLDKEVQRGKVGYFGKDGQANRVYHIHDKSVTLLGEAGGGAAKMGQYLFGCITSDRVIDGYIRKLTPLECERLQTLPEEYTNIEGLSNAQRYKMIGNGWTVDVIAHIFKSLQL